MAKSDFEFYHIEGLEGDFVVPAPASDPYHGAYEVPAIPDLALDAIARIVTNNAGPGAIETVEAKPEETGDYFFNTTLRGCEVIRQKANITVSLTEEDGYYSTALKNVFRELSTSPGMTVIPAQKPALDIREPEQPIAYREYAAIENRLYLLDENDEPMHPSMLVRQFVPIKAYRWLPGPERNSKDSGKLPPTYSPRPINLAAAQLIEIKGINPLVAAD